MRACRRIVSERCSNFHTNVPIQLGKDNLLDLKALHWDTEKDLSNQWPQLECVCESAGSQTSHTHTHARTCVLQDGLWADQRWMMGHTGEFRPGFRNGPLGFEACRLNEFQQTSYKGVFGSLGIRLAFMLIPFGRFFHPKQVRQKTILTQRSRLTFKHRLVGSHETSALCSLNLHFWLTDKWMNIYI